jgi:hypothetical protein
MKTSQHPKYISDTTVFCGVLAAAGINQDLGWYSSRTRNELDMKTGIRRLTVSVYGQPTPQRLTKARAQAREKFGVRFVSLTTRRGQNYSNGWRVVLVLDDNCGAAPRRPINPNPRRKQIAPTPTFLRGDALLAFWNDSLDKPVTLRDLGCGAIRTLTRPVGVFKKIHRGCAPMIANLILPAGARVHITGDKCRAEHAFVQSIVSSTGVQHTSGRSSHRESFVYHAGRTVTPDGFDARAGTVCASGIHFFACLKRTRDYY